MNAYPGPGIFAALVPVIIIPVVIIIMLAVVRVLRDALSGGKGQNASGGDIPYRQQGNRSKAAYNGEKRYARQVHEMHRGDPREEYSRRMEQLRNLYNSGMMERDEFEERKAAIEDDYRNGRQL